MPGIEHSRRCSVGRVARRLRLQPRGHRRHRPQRPAPGAVEAAAVPLPVGHVQHPLRRRQAPASRPAPAPAPAPRPAGAAPARPGGPRRRSPSARGRRGRARPRCGRCGPAAATRVRAVQLGDHRVVARVEAVRPVGGAQPVGHRRAGPLGARTPGGDPDRPRRQRDPHRRGAVGRRRRAPEPVVGRRASSGRRRPRRCGPSARQQRPAASPASRRPRRRRRSAWRCSGVAPGDGSAVRSASGSARRHAQRAVHADDLAVEVAVLDDVRAPARRSRRAGRAASGRVCPPPAPSAPPRAGCRAAACRPARGRWCRPARRRWRGPARPAGSGRRCRPWTPRRRSGRSARRRRRSRRC